MARFLLMMCCILFALACTASVRAQQQAPSNVNPAPAAASTTSARGPTNPPPVAQDRATTDARAATGYVTYKTPYEFWLTGLTIAMLSALGVLLALMAYMGTLTHQFYKAFLILTVVFAA